MSTTVPTPAQLTPEQLDAFGARARRDPRARDRRPRRARRRPTSAASSRPSAASRSAAAGLLQFGFLPPAWLAGTAALSLSKILDNMEIGHNVMHGQYDWMNDPALNGHAFEWDSACPAEQWRHSHNYMHHTHTNILGKDRDIGYGVLRMSEDQRWHPYYLGNPAYAVLLALFFQWGVALHDLEVERLNSGKATWGDKREMLQAIWRKGRRQALKDYALFPLLAGPSAPLTFAGNMTANAVPQPVGVHDHLLRPLPRGHARVHRGGDAKASRAAQWYVRQLLGSANITGGTAVPHHDRQPQPPDRAPPVPGPPGRTATREMAVEVREICERYGLPYNTGPLHKQFGSVVKKIVKLALPGARGGEEPAAAPVELTPKPRHAERRAVAA